MLHNSQVHDVLSAGIGYIPTSLFPGAWIPRPNDLAVQSPAIPSPQALKPSARIRKAGFWAGVEKCSIQG